MNFTKLSYGIYLSIVMTTFFLSSASCSRASIASSYTSDPELESENISFNHITDVLDLLKSGDAEAGSIRLEIFHDKDLTYYKDSLSTYYNLHKNYYLEVL